MEAKLASAFKSTTMSTTVGSRQFSGPSEKKQYYVAQYIHLIAASDPENKQFTKGELVDAHNALRKSVSTNPSLFKLIQAVVDEGVFVDDYILELMDTDENTLPNVTVDSLQRLDCDLAVQNKLKHLSEFNSVQMSNKSESAQINFEFDENSISHEDLTCFSELARKDIHCQINEDISNLIISRPIDTVTIESHFNNTINNVQLQINDFNTFIGKMATSFKFNLIETDQRIAEILFTYNKLSIRKLFEQNKKCKEKFLILHCFLSDLRNNLSHFEQQMSTYLTRQQIKSDLKSIKIREDKLISKLKSPNQLECKQPNQIMDFLQKHQLDLDMGRLISGLHKIENNIILNENELKKINKRL